MTKPYAGYTFEQWMLKVNYYLYRKCGMGADDIPDYCYRDCYNAGDAPAEVADQAIQNAKDY